MKLKEVHSRVLWKWKKISSQEQLFMLDKKKLIKFVKNLKKVNHVMTKLVNMFTQKLIKSSRPTEAKTIRIISIMKNKK